MASIASGSDLRPQHCPAPPDPASSDVRGSEAFETLDRRGPRYIYYRLYIKDGPITSNNPIYTNNPFIGRALPKHITPPRTALSLKKHLCKIEGLSGTTSCTLFESLSSQAAVVESSRLPLRNCSCPGLSEDDPIVLVVGVEDASKRPASTARLEGLPEAVSSEPRYVYYRLYDDDGAVASKMSFDSDDSSLGRINTLSIAPPQTVSSLKSQVVKAEGLVNQELRLFEDMDGEVLMNDNNHLSLHTQSYPGHVEDEPITITFGVDPSFSRQIKGLVTWNPCKIYQKDWLPFKYNEIMYTDGIKTTGFIMGSTHPYSGYITINSAGEKGFVHDGHATLC